MKKKFIGFFCVWVMLFAFFILPTNSFAWGEHGHPYLVELTLKYMPSEVRNFWNSEQQNLMITRWANFPDGQFASPEEIALMGDDYEYIKLATTEKIRRNRFHYVHTKGVLFFALVKAFRENRPDKASMYAGTLLHSYADAGAFNHGSMMQYLEYTRYKHVKYPKNIPHNDVSKISTDEKAQEVIKKLLSDFKPDSTTKNLNKEIENVMMTGVILTKQMSQVEASIGKINPDGTASKESFDAITKIVATQVKEGVNIIYSAWLIAKSNQPLDSSKLDIAWDEKPHTKRPNYARFLMRRYQYIKDRDARDDNVYDGLWNNKKYPAIAFIAESAYEMAEGMHGFGARFATAIIARGLKNFGENVQLFSFPDFEKKIPDVKKYPILVVHSKAGVSARIRKNVEKYVENGGKVIYIGGAVSKEKIVAMNSKKRADEETPVSTKWAKQNQDIIGQMKIEFAPVFAKVKAGKFGFKDNPNQIGWNKPIANEEIILDDTTEPLAYLHLPNGEKYCVSAVKLEGGKPRHIYLPAYLFLPFMFSDENEMADWSKATTDSFGTSLIVESVKLLMNN